MVYPQSAFARHLIPDIVMRKEDFIWIWEAKYKSMTFKRTDLDREDFYQIHSYMSYFGQQKHFWEEGCCIR